MNPPVPTAAIRALPLVRPFVAPEELARRVGVSDVIRLGANESAFGPSPRALAAMRDEVARTSWYGDPESIELREALAARHGCAIGNLCVGAGIDDLLGLVVRAYLAPGDVTVAALGTYPTYAYHVRGYGAELASVPYERDGTIPLDALADLARARDARVVYLANPDNPSGSFAHRDDVAALRDAMPPRCLLVLDEAYADFVPAAERLAPEIDPRVVRMRTFSKAYGLAGARVAYAIAAPEVVDAFDKIRLQFGTPRVAQTGALASLADDAFVARIVEETARGRDEYRALGAALGIATLPSRTNFVCFEIGTAARADAAIARLLHLGIFVRKPVAPPLDGFVRVTVGSAADRAAFAERFATTLRG